MKSPKFLPRSLALAVFALSAASPSAHADTFDWTGTTSGIWATTTNWFSGTAPANNLTSDIARFNQATYGNQPTATSAGSVAGLIFGGSSGAVTLTTSNNAARLNVGASGIVVNSGAAEVIIGTNSNQGLQLGASQAWTNNSSSLLTVTSLSGQTAGQNYVLTMNGSGSGGTAITGAIRNDYSEVNSGTVSLVINTTGGVTTISGANFFTGDTTLTSGVLALNNTNALQRSALNTAGTGTVTTSVTTLALGGLKGSRDVSAVFTSGFGSVTALTLNPQSGTSVYTGVISNGAATTSLTKAGAGTQVLEGANTYTGVTNINGGVLAVSSLGNASAPSTLGASANTANNLVVSGGTLQLTGTTTAAQSTDRLFSVGNSGGTLDSSAGVGSSMNFTNVGTITAANTTGHRTLTLTGSEDGSIASIIGQRNGTDSTTAILKTGNGTWTLSGSNTYTGSTQVNAGTLLINGSVASAVAVGADSAIGGTGTINSTLSLVSDAKFVLNLTEALTVTGAVSLDNSFSIASLVNADGSAVDWSLVGLGTYTLIESGSDFSNIQNFGLANAVNVGGKIAYFENGSLALVVAVPEPSTWLLLTGGLTCVLVMRRRRH